MALMKTPRRTMDTPYQVIDLITEETVGWYDTAFNAAMDNRGKQTDVYYRPFKRKVKK